MITVYIYNKPAILVKPDGVFSYGDLNGTKTGWRKNLPVHVAIFIKLVYGGHASKRYKEIHTRF